LCNFFELYINTPQTLGWRKESETRKNEQRFHKQPKNLQWPLGNTDH